MVKQLIASLLVGVSFVANANQLPPRSIPLIPVLIEEQKKVYPNHPNPFYLAGQIEQETCISLKHSKCWNPRAELKTSREYGFGLSQITITNKFNNFEEAKKWDKSISDWQWDDRYNPVYQIRALLAYMRNLNVRINGVPNAHERYAMTLSAYNGGLGGLNKDRVLCKSTPQCDQSKWFGNVEHTSLKAKKPVHGYKQSFFEINREYVTNVMYIRSTKYKKYMESLQ
jgi:hypothetical protein